MILVFSFLLIFSCIALQYLDFAYLSWPFSFLTSVCLSFMMIEVGIKFSSESKLLRSYGWDLVYASRPALLQALLLWVGYILLVFKSQPSFGDG